MPNKVSKVNNLKKKGVKTTKSKKVVKTAGINKTYFVVGGVVVVVGIVVGVLFATGVFKKKEQPSVVCEEECEEEQHLNKPSGVNPNNKPNNNPNNNPNNKPNNNPNNKPTGIIDLGLNTIPNNLNIVNDINPIDNFIEIIKKILSDIPTERIINFIDTNQQRYIEFFNTTINEIRATTPSPNMSNRMETIKNQIADTLFNNFNKMNIDIGVEEEEIREHINRMI